MLKKISLLFCLLAIPTTFAVTISTLYQGELPVASHSSADWKKAVTPALEQVLIKVSGNPKIAQIDAIKRGMSKAADMVQSYNYVLPDANTGQKVLTMQVRFSPKLVNDLLQQGNQGILPKDRPLTLVWLAIINTPNQPPMALSDSKNIIVATMQNEATKAALPLLWPSMDMQDMSAISAVQIANLDQTMVQNASKRYQADGVLVGKIVKQSPTSWQGQWLWISDQGNQNWQTQGATPQQTAVAVLPQLSGAITAVLNSSGQSSRNDDNNNVPNNTPPPQANANNYSGSNVVPAVSTSAVQTMPTVAMNNVPVVVLQVIGVNGLDDYAGLMDYFHSLGTVTAVNVLQTQGDKLTVKLKISSTSDQLFKQISAGNKLIMQSATPGQIPVYHLASSQQSMQAQNMTPVAGQTVTVAGTGDTAPIVAGVPITPNQQANSYPGMSSSANAGEAQTFPVDNDNTTFAPEQSATVPEEVIP